ncbi:class I SAM-dependent DNA methyltransferase [Henriciella barbarensis]|uniref:site-specific DNA-methyltransferase (adenine-specific) n=1 Tax=Henriciella barbarensis TaxID=86342 RepID=A0A399QW31_9PROT|nr:DNA methyltransferase [Henriciella barbarensis]RIJ22305.1 class I SAM-dependent DNA methyltransferase [Henriciella barbarensis]
MTPSDFIRKWERSELKESASAQQHFLDLCELLDVAKPAEMDHSGDSYCFEKGATKSTGGQGFADVWKKGCFGWEYKGPKANLDAAYAQLQRYAVALESPPLLIVSDTKRIVIYTNWTNTVSEKHDIALTDLLDQKWRDLLRNCFTNPGALKPKRTRDDLTREAADDFSKLAQRLRDRGHAPEIVAHFVNRLVFCMFAEDVSLLPNKLFQKAMERSQREPERAQGHLINLFAAMQNGGEFGLEDIPWFNGGLFDSADALPMDRDDVDLALKAAKLYWGDIDPSILGTLFERGLDPSKRSQLGAHYTDREKIMMIVNPVIVEPLTAEWDTVKAQIFEEMEKSRTAKSSGAQTQAYNRAVKAHSDFIEKLANFRVLDPACGSGNFLYLSLKALKDIEHKANVEAEALGLPRGFPRVGPEAVKGIELNPYAAELARVSIWIGEIQWMRENGFSVADNPILKPLNTIECRDAILNADGTRAEWPDADVVVGNPPFLGSRMMIEALGESYSEALRTSWTDLPDKIDLVCYWFGKAWEQIQAGTTKRVGFVATNSITGGANREILRRIVHSGRVVDAWRDEPWVVEGTSVRVSLVCFDGQNHNPELVRLDGISVPSIYSDLSSGGSTVDLTLARKIVENVGACFEGFRKYGPLDISGHVAREWLRAPLNVNGLSNQLVLKPTVNGQDIVRRPSDTWIIDFHGFEMGEAAYFEQPFSHALKHVKPYRDGVRDANRRERWWQFGRTGENLRSAMFGLERLIVTPQVSKFRIFCWLPTQVALAAPNFAIARHDDTSFGILHSKFHELWSLRTCTFLGKGNDPRYTPTTCFETFPFPKGLTPDIPAEVYADDPRAKTIAAAAARLNDLRENWLNPPDLIKRVPEVVEGYPDRILPVDEAAEKILKKRTLTNLYNERPAWLGHAHRALDEAVAEAYGWGDDFRAGTLSDEEILKRLFELNQARAVGQ